MAKGLKLTTAFVLLVSVLGVFVAPSVDLEPSALRAARAALMTMLAIANAAAVILTLVVPALHAQSALIPHATILHRDSGILDLDCARLC